MSTRILVTAGPTREPVDAIRFLGNRSTGTMGFAIADSAARRGWTVKLVAGPVALPTPDQVQRIDVETAAEMRSAVRREFDWCDMLIMAAAVADWRPAEPVSGKMKKHDGDLHLRLVRTVDILRELGREKTSQYLVGFAAESEHLEAYATRKLQDKNLNAIVANPVLDPDAGFATDTNRGLLLFADGRIVPLPLQAKTSFAEQLLDVLKPDFDARIPG